MSNDNQKLIGSLFISIASFLAFYLILQTYDQIRELKIATNNRKELLESRTKTIDNILRIKKDYESSNKIVETISMPIPSRKGVPELISSFEFMANSSGLSLVKLNIIENKQEKGELRTMQLEGKLTGSYESFKNFLSLTETSRRLIDTSSVKLILDKNTNTIAIDFSGKAYVLDLESKTNTKADNKNNLNTNEE